MIEIIRSANRKARKDHKCDWCGGPISKGEIYNVQTNAHDRDIYSWKGHLECEDLAHKLNMYDYDDGDGITSDTFRESLKEYLYLKLDEEEYELMEDNLSDYEQVQYAIKLLEEDQNE